MGRKAYVGINNVARKVKKIYVGVGDSPMGVARTVRRGYVGVGGVARLFWGGGELVYNGVLTPLTAAVYLPAATTVGDHAIFAGGFKQENISGDPCTTNVDTYNRSLTKGRASGISVKRYGAAAETIGGHAVIVGGAYYKESSFFYNDDVDVYNESLTRSTLSGINTKTFEMASTVIGGYALFGGGEVGDERYSSRVYAYDQSLTLVGSYLTITANSSSAGKGGLAATSIGEYALFGGGRLGSRYTDGYVTAFNTSLTKTNAPVLSRSRYRLSATSTESHAIFAGGWDDTQLVNNSVSDLARDIVDAYNQSLTRTTTTLSEGRSDAGATNVAGFAVFAGGRRQWLGACTSTTDAFDSSLTRFIPHGVDYIGYGAGSTTIGDFGIFGGGKTPDMTAAVESYTVI